MAPSQDAIEDVDQGHTDHSEAKKLPDRPSGKAKEILAGGYTEGKRRLETFSVTSYVILSSIVLFFLYKNFKLDDIKTIIFAAGEYG
ncbi:hypothetical protein ACROYT_G013130 [Oculina patagonica]